MRGGTSAFRWIWLRDSPYPEMDMARLKRLHKEVEGPNGWSRWVRPVMRKYFMACCDCGLVHEMQFYAAKVVLHGKNGYWSGQLLHRRGYRVMFRARRAPRYTARQRARRKQ